MFLLLVGGSELQCLYKRERSDIFFERGFYLGREEDDNVLEYLIRHK